MFLSVIVVSELLLRAFADVVSILQLKRPSHFSLEPSLTRADFSDIYRDLSVARSQLVANVRAPCLASTRSPYFSRDDDA